MKISAAMMLLVLAPPLCCQPRTAKNESSSLVIEHVNVLTMDKYNIVVPNATVVLQGQRIVELGLAGDVSIPPGAKRLDASGKWLMPALSDMHVHLPNDSYTRRKGGSAKAGVFDTQDQLTPYVANGVLQVFNLSAVPETVGMRMEVDAGYVIGPHIANAAMIDGNPPVRPGPRIASTPEDGRQAVRDIKVEGYDAVKTYSRLTVGTYLAIVDEARTQGLKVVGHIPNEFRGKTDEAFVPGYGLIAHAEELAKQSADLSDNDIKRFTAMAKRNGTWLVSTLTSSEWIVLETKSLNEVRALSTLRYVHPLLVNAWLNDNGYIKNSTPERLEHLQKIAEFSNRIVKAFVAADIPVLPGTDASLSGVVPGFSLHDELELLSKGGVPNALVLRSATRSAAQWLGVLADRGTVEVGKRADLLLLDANPLDDVANTRKISAVIVSGRYLSRQDLDSMMNSLAKRNAASAAAYATAGEILPNAAASFRSTGN